MDADDLVDGLSHLDASGAARMVDVSDRDVTDRVAVATGAVLLSEECLAALRDGAVPKGDVLAVARVAGIMAAKRTSALVPMCHPIEITGVTVDLAVQGSGVAVTATVRTTGRTGVEMEALTAVAVTCLTVVDMTKSIDPRAVIDGVALQSKTGGRSGSWQR